MQTPTPRTRVLLRVEELYSRTLPAVMDPAGLALLGDDAEVSTADDPVSELSIDETGIVAEDGTFLYEVTMLADGETLPNTEDITPEDLIAWCGTADDVIWITDEVLTAEIDPAVCYFADVLPAPAEGDLGEVLMAEIDPAICYMVDVPPEPAKGDDADPALVFGAPEPIDLPNFVPATSETDPAGRADPTAVLPSTTRPATPGKTEAGEPGLVPAAPQPGTADGMDLPLGKLAGTNG